MVRAKTSFDDEAMVAIAPVKQRLRELFAADQMQSDEAALLEKQLKTLAILYPADLKHPIWPFSTAIFVAFYTSQIVPVIGVVTGVIEFVKLF